MASKRPQKPDQAVYRATLTSIDGEIASTKSKLDALKSKISSVTSNASKDPNDPAVKLRARLGELRETNAGIKKQRETLLEKIKTHQAAITKKTNEIKAIRAKVPFRSREDLEARIKELEASVESGQLKLIDEKRMIHEMSGLKRNRKVFESMVALQNDVDVERTALDGVRKALDDHPGKSVMDEIADIQKQLDGLSQQRESDWKNRNELFTQRNQLQKDMDALYAKKREVQNDYRKANDVWYAWQQEEYQRKQEKLAKQRAEEKRAKLLARVAEEREAAEMDAFVGEMNTCDTLVKVLQGYLPKEEVVAEKKVKETKAFDGMVLLKKDNDDEEGYFAGKGGKKGKKKPPKEDKAVASAPTGAFKAPLGLLESFMDISVDPPMRIEDIPTTIETIKAKKQWYAENQARVSKERRDKVEAKIAKIMKEAEAEDTETNGTTVVQSVSVTETVTATAESVTESVTVTETLQVVQES